jgi:hypothetical protein
VRTGNARSAGHFRDLVSEPVLTLEFGPLLNRIISPPIRPVRNFVYLACIDESNTLHNTGQQPGDPPGGESHAFPPREHHGLPRAPFRAGKGGGWTTPIQT